jgi:hypothetical protein
VMSQRYWCMPVLSDSSLIPEPVKITLVLCSREPVSYN